MLSISCCGREFREREGHQGRVWRKLADDVSTKLISVPFKKCLSIYILATVPKIGFEKVVDRGFFYTGLMI